MKNKAPAFQFYVKDWLSDSQLQMCSCATRGIWINFLAYMWSSPYRGELEGTREDLQKLAGAAPSELRQFFDDADKYGFCDYSVTGNAIITIINRRMSREENFKLNNRLRQQKVRDNKKVTTTVTEKSRILSSTASASATAKKEKNIQKKNFKKPTVEQIKKYCIERKNNVDSEKFFNFYESKGWMVGKNKMKNWKAAVRTWEKPDGSNKRNNGKGYKEARGPKTNWLD